MSVATDIVRSYRMPRSVLRKRVAGGTREDRALAVLFAACLLIFISRWPAASRQAFEDPSVPLDARIGANLMAIMFVMPLMCYGLAALSHLLARAFGGRASWFEARMALFWAMLASTPMWLFSGLIEGFLGAGPALRIVEFLTLATFLVLWGAGLYEVEAKHRPSE